MDAMLTHYDSVFSLLCILLWEFLTKQIPVIPQPLHLLHLAPTDFNPLNVKLNPICHLLALLGAHHILHVSRIRVNVLQAVNLAVWKKISENGSHQKSGTKFQNTQNKSM
jgi:hypothetical protein